MFSGSSQRMEALEVIVNMIVYVVMCGLVQGEILLPSLKRT